MHIILSYAVQINTILPGTSREPTAVQKINDDIMEDNISTENFNDKGQNNGVTFPSGGGSRHGTSTYIYIQTS